MKNNWAKKINSWSKKRQGWSKHWLVAVLLLTNLASGSYILAKQTNFQPMLKAMEHDNRSTLAKSGLTISGLNRGVVETPTNFKNDAEMQACYKAFLAKQPPIDEGSVVVNWKYNRKGKIDWFNLVHTDLKDEAFTECLIERLRRAKMPVMQAGTIVAHKFNFKRVSPSKLDY